MRVMGLDDQVGDGELDLVCPQAIGVALRCQAVTAAEIEKDVGALADQHSPGLQERRGEGGAGRVGAVEESHHPVHAAGLAADVDIVGSGFLEGEADELAAALDARPVIKLIAHGVSSPPHPFAARRTLACRAAALVARPTLAPEFARRDGNPWVIKDLTSFERYTRWRAQAMRPRAFQPSDGIARSEPCEKRQCERSR